jgi:hypothetical protein
MNLEDPLAQLRDIHLPQPVEAWPPGPGWWLLGALLLALLGSLAWWTVKRYRGNAWRRQAYRELDRTYRDWQSHGDDSLFLQQLSEILKRAAIRGEARDVAALCGARWSQYLDERWRSAPARGFTALDFGEAAYRPDATGAEIEELHRLGQRWLREFRGAAC